MSFKKLAFVAALLLAPQAARAEVGIGAFLGEPTGLDLMLGLQRNSSLDILFGWYSHYDGDRYGIDDGAYAHVTYLLEPVVSHGQSIDVPLRVGIGGAVFDDSGRFNDHLHLAVRVPFEVALDFRSAPLEIYGEVALKLTVIDPDDTHRLLDLDGGLGIRFFF